MSYLLILRAADIARITPNYSKLVDLVGGAIVELTHGLAANPAKIALWPDEDTLAISMLGYSPKAGCVGFKSYAEFSSSARTHAGTSLTLLEMETGLPIAFMDCQWITAARTGAVCALMAQHLSRSPKSVLMIGAGHQSQGIIPVLMNTLPDIEEISVLTKSQVVFDTLASSISQAEGKCRLTRCENVLRYAGEADVVIGATGPQSPNAVSLNMLKPGALAIYVGHGLAPDILHGADRVIATSRDQMALTGQDLADNEGNLPTAHAELGDVLLNGRKGRTSPNDIIAAYNSGLAVTDVVVGRYLYDVLKERGGGSLVVGFTPRQPHQSLRTLSGAA